MNANIYTSVKKLDELHLFTDCKYCRLIKIKKPNMEENE